MSALGGSAGMSGPRNPRASPSAMAAARVSSGTPASGFARRAGSGGGDGGVRRPAAAGAPLVPLAAELAPLWSSRPKRTSTIVMPSPAAARVWWRASRRGMWGSDGATRMMAVMPGVRGMERIAWTHRGRD